MTRQEGQPMQQDGEEIRTAKHAGHAPLGGHDVRRVALIDRDIYAEDGNKSEEAR